MESAQIKEIVKEALKIVDEMQVPDDLRTTVCAYVLSKFSAESTKMVEPASRAPQQTEVPHVTFAEFFVGLETTNKADEITAMAYYHAAKNPNDPRLSVKDIGEYYAEIKPKAGNIFRDAKTAQTNAWIKTAEKKEGTASWEIIGMGKRRVEEMMRHEE